MSKAKEKYDQAESKVDSFLDKLRASPYTVGWIAAAAIAVLVLWVLVG